MNPKNVTKLIPTAQEALSSFLATLLGQPSPIEMGEVSETTREQILQESTTMLSIVPKTDPTFVVQLSPNWLPLLSKSMLGEAIGLGDEGYKDLTCELMGQAYGALRTALAGDGISLSEAMFDVVHPETPFVEQQVPELVYRVPFHLTIEEDTLEGQALLPYQQSPEVVTEDVSEAAAVAEDATATIPVTPLAFPDLGRESIGDGGGYPFGLLADVELEVTVELGRRRLSLSDILRLTNGSVIELEKLVGEPLEVYANGRFIAEGEAVVIDEQFGIRITSLAASRSRDKVIQ